MPKIVLTFLFIFFCPFLIIAQTTKKEIMIEARQLLENRNYKAAEKLILELANNEDIEAQYLMCKVKILEIYHHRASRRRIKNIITPNLLHNKIILLSKEQREWLIKANNHAWLKSKNTNDEDSIRIQYVSLEYNPHYGYMNPSEEYVTEKQRLNIVKLAAEKNIYNSQYIYASMIRQDSLESLKWFKIAANNNNAEAQEQLGHHYEIGKVAKTNIDSALYWYSRAIKLEHLEGFYYTGLIYQQGKHVEKDINKALFYYNSCYELSKHKGYSDYTAALFRIGEIYIEKEDYKNAIKTYKLFESYSSDFGFANYKLGEIYAKLEKYNKAIYYLTKSNKPEAKRKLKEIRNR